MPFLQTKNHLHMSLPSRLAGCFAVLLTVTSCSKLEKPVTKRTMQKSQQNAIATPPADPPHHPGNPHSLKDVQALSHVESTAFFKNQCLACHDSESGPMKNFYSLDKDNTDPMILATDPIGPTVYYVLFKKAWGIESPSPIAMPTGQSTDESRLEIKRLLKWFEMNQPDLVLASAKKYEFESDLSQATVVTNFICKNPLTVRQQLTRVTSDAFDRLPTPAELSSFGDKLDRTATKEDRVNLAKRVFNDSAWKKEFVDVGLRKFARRLSASGQMQQVEGWITADQAADLQDEFYQLLKRDFDTKSFKDTLLTKSLMVSKNTAAFYGCSIPDSGWSDCEVSPSRASYFASMSFLRSTPSSFLQENNNYKRAAIMQFFIRGDVIHPATDGPKGDGDIAPLPACLITRDARGVVQSSGTVAPFGVSSIPQYGNRCQSCHIDRHLAAGSMVFRPYNSVGFQYGSAFASVLSNDSDFVTATQSDRVIDSFDPSRTPVTADFLTNLLNSPDEKICVTTSTSQVPISNIFDLSAHLIGDGKVLAGALAKHLPRTLSNMSYTSEEIIRKIADAYDQGGGLLGPAIEAYFASETFGCARLSQ